MTIEELMWRILELNGLLQYGEMVDMIQLLDECKDVDYTMSVILSLLPTIRPDDGSFL